MNGARTRVAVVGAGYFGRFHYDAWTRMEDCALVGLCTRSGRGAAEVADAFRVPATFTDLGRMLDETRPDVIDITAPPEAHLDAIATAAPTSRWIVCQKPFCRDLAEAREAVRLAQVHGARVVVHENVRFQPWYREIRRLLEDGAVGRPYQVTFRLRPGDGQGPDAYLERQPYFREMPRFLVHETAIHWIDTFRYLLGEVTAVSADLRRLNPAIAGEDAGFVQLAFAGGARGLFDGNRLADHAAANRRLTLGEMELEGSAGTIRLDGFARITRRAHGSNDWREHVYRWQDRHFGGDCVYLANRAALSQARPKPRPTPICATSRSRQRSTAVTRKGAGSMSEGLVGTWTLERFTLALPDGEVIEPLGAAPVGRLVYTASGFMSAHLMPGNDARPVATLGYCGRWRVEGDRVLHDVEISSRAGMTGTTQVRPMALDGNVLVLTSERARAGADPDAPTGVGRLRWRRIDGAETGGGTA